MVGPTLIDIRERIDDLATDDGQYFVVCGRTGDRPVPAAGNRFPDRATARAAARATEQYRSALRRYDPQVPYYDLIVCQTSGRAPEPVRPADGTGNGSLRHRSDAAGDDDTTERRELVEFCHRVSCAIFETLSGKGYDDVESAVMDAYFELAETLADPDELCLSLLESMASELDERLRPVDQAEVLAAAANRLEPVEERTDALSGALSTLDAHGLIENYARSPWTADLDSEARSVTVRIDEYALSPRDECLPVLPLMLELARRRSAMLPQSIEVTEVDGGWQLTFRVADGGERNGLVNPPVHEAV